MRVRTGPSRRQKHKKILDLARGYRMSRHRLIKSSSIAVLHAGEYAFAGRKNRKRDFRKLWIIRINAALSGYDLPYSRFVACLNKAQIQLDRKILADLAVSDSQTFKSIVEKAKLQL